MNFVHIELLILCCFWFHIDHLVASSNDPPVISRIVSTQMSQSQGSVLNLMCPISSGSQPITFKWFKDNIEIKHANQRGSINNNPSFSVLIIPELELKDSGNYSCVVSNAHGIDVQWTFLQVKGIKF